MDQPIFHGVDKSLPLWGHSFYYNFYDPNTKTAALIRVGFMENRREMNVWFVFFKDGLPIFNRVNMNLPHSSGFAVSSLSDEKRSISCGV